MVVCGGQEPKTRMTRHRTMVPLLRTILANCSLDHRCQCGYICLRKILHTKPNNSHHYLQCTRN
uniref:Uncharacterized protein n=1 Tax=Manihot esculenta TaxID=3983 RepID=A0A2C9VWM8_MANES